MKHDEQEQANTASQEIEVARRNLAKAVNKALDEGVGDKRATRLFEMARVIEMIR